ncbi:MAG: glycosyltransferase family 4 protein [Paracoccaceae bacterium]
MRILQISHNFHMVGGSDAAFFATSKMLSDAGHEVIPFCMENRINHPSRWSRYFPRAADARRAPLRDTFRYFFNSEARDKLRQLLDDVGPVDAAHLHIYHGKQTPAILPVLRERGITVVHSLHEYKLACPVYTLQRDGEPCELCVQGSSLNCIRHRCKDGSFSRSVVMAGEYLSARLLGDVRLVDRFICVSEFQRQIMARAGIPPAKLSTLHNFVDTGAIAAEHGHDGYYLYFGRIEKLKGLSTLLSAVAQSGHRLLIAGDGAWRDEMQTRISDQSNVKYLGYQHGEALRRIVGRAKAVIVPSRWYENCPMSVLEAKAQARPVIAARIGGLPELVRDGTDGFLFKAGDAQDLQRAFAALEAADHGRLSRAARQDAETRFSKSVHLRSLLKHYAGRRTTTAAREAAMQPA